MGDDGFDTFCAASYNRLLKYVFLLTGDLGEAEDVLQESYARAFVRWERISRFDAPEAWVRRVAMNLASKSARRLRRQARAVARLVFWNQRAGPVSVDQAIDLLAALRRLPFAQRQAIVLHDLDGVPVEQIARQLGVATGTVKARLSRGRRSLRADLEPSKEVRA